ncbi:UTP--glucose-1-phosphate uridylyltransferase GalU [Sutcliffiella halmapala]|uniref:UTP--glucose-1-phosphate uridylyltransferase GalU n=1 Tax=Sutcliffiella halmapala TaxID=79882 RepID=UPI000995C5CC|nr:UTP--glucose-1-phosphate uridylyltransferase GalU [Sutcliffiella halmapala]
MNIRKAIIPAAGLGTRFLPATKAQPKEMLPIVDKPTIQYIVEEAVQSGIEDIIIVSGRGKRAIEDHFDKSYELEETLAKKRKVAELEALKEISNLANIHYIRQGEPLGLGHAIWCARKFIGNEPFAVMLGDDIVHASKPCLGQMMNVFDKYNASVVGVQGVAEAEVSKYGIISTRGYDMEKNVMNVEALIEKPSIEAAPSKFAIMGRYILRPEIFAILEDLPAGSGGEIQLTDAISVLSRTQEVLAFHFEGDRYDVGDKFGFIKAQVDFALQREDLRKEVLAHLSDVMARFAVNW